MPGHSRQRVWQKKMVSQSRCAKCGKPQGRHRGFCDLHYRNHLIRMRGIARQWMRENRGYKPWIPGHTGRPPLDRNSQTLARLAKRLRQIDYKIDANTKERRRNKTARPTKAHPLTA